MSEARKSTGNSLFHGGRYRLAMGLMPQSEAEWLSPDASLREILAEKRQLLATRHESVFRTLREASEASVELLQLLAKHLTRHFPSLYRLDGTRALFNGATGETWDIDEPPLHPLDIAGRLMTEDLCLLQASDDGYRLIGASLCFPNRWLLEEKIGQPLDFIHDPVPGFAPALQRPVARFFAALKPDRILARVNWGIADEPARFQPIGHDADAGIGAANAGSALYLRVERQTLRRLPESQVVLFTIRTEITPLDQVIATHDDARDLAGAIHDMSPAMLRYKHLTAVAPALLAWLETRQKIENDTKQGVS
jgi:dimethylamine monooxygenase subunit A